MNEQDIKIIGAFARTILALVIYVRRADLMKDQIATCYEHADEFVDNLKLDLSKALED